MDTFALIADYLSDQEEGMIAHSADPLSDVIIFVFPPQQP
jgi:hypothetical protein